MKALVIYDSTGKIWSIVYGEENAPQGLLSMFVDIPEGAMLERIDVTDSENPKAVFSYLPESDIGKLQKQVKEIEEYLNPTIDVETCTLDELKDWYVADFGKKCTALIYAGSDVVTKKGTKHFSYTSDDQRNLKAAADLAAQTGLQMPYHADGEDCTLFDAVDIINIYGTNEILKTYQTTYCNLMNGIIRGATEKSQITALTYGDELPEDKQHCMTTSMAQAQTVFEKYLEMLDSVINPSTEDVETSDSTENDSQTESNVEVTE